MLARALEVLKSDFFLLFLQDFSVFIVYKNVPEKKAKEEKTYLPYPRHERKTLKIKKNYLKIKKKYLKTKKTEKLQRKNKKNKENLPAKLPNYTATITYVIYTISNSNCQFYLPRYTNVNYSKITSSNYILYTPIINSIIYNLSINLFTIIKIKLGNKLITWSRPQKPKTKCAKKRRKTNNNYKKENENTLPMLLMKLINYIMTYLQGNVYKSNQLMKFYLCAIKMKNRKNDYSKIKNVTHTFSKYSTLLIANYTFNYYATKLITLKKKTPPIKPEEKTCTTLYTKKDFIHILVPIFQKQFYTKKFNKKWYNFSIYFDSKLVIIDRLIKPRLIQNTLVVARRNNYKLGIHCVKKYPLKYGLKYMQPKHGRHSQPRVKQHQDLEPLRPRRLGSIHTQPLGQAHHKHFRHNIKLMEACLFCITVHTYIDNNLVRNPCYRDRHQVEHHRHVVHKRSPKRPLLHPLSLSH